MGKSKPAKILAIPTVVQPNAKTLQFSFKHLDLTSEKFSVDACPLPFWASLARKLNEYSQWPTDAFIDQNNQERRHIIDFTETTEQNGFAHLNTEQLGYMETWQFCVGPEHWRVLGFVLEDVFYIVWLDPRHALYGGYGGNSAAPMEV